MNDTTVLVTGATGFIAGHCIEELLTHGYAVRGGVRDPATADVAHLHALAHRSGGSLELVAARLDDDACWAEAVDGCTYVWHVASPNPPAVPEDADDLIRPAVEGTLRVLRAAAASATVRRVVLTSSTDAITHGHPDSRVHTEADWSDPARSGPYPRSKLYAERAGAIGLALSLVGQQQLVTACKAVAELGWGTRPASQSIIDSAESLLHYGVVGRSRPDTRTPQLA